MDDWVALAAHINRGCVARNARVAIQPADLIYDRHRDGECLWADLDEQRARDLEADRELHGEQRSLTRAGIHLQRSTEARDHVAHDIQPNTAATLFRDRFGGADTRLED